MLRAASGLAFLLVALGAALFGPAWTLDYWQAWVFLAVFGSVVLAITIYLAIADPALLARRTKAGVLAEPEPFQKVVQALASLAFLAIFVVASLDRRHAWSSVPTWLVIAGDVLVALGLAIVFLVFRENTFTSATIEVSREQTLVSTGPYAIVRHPMYAGAFVMLLGAPLALGSWWSFAGVVAVEVVIVIRLLDEEKLLATSLPGYPEYRQRVRYRLVPRVW